MALPSKNLHQHYAGKTVLVTGHTGFKGAWLCEWLLMLGARVVGIALPPNTAPALFDQLRLADRLEHHLLDIRDRDALTQRVLATEPDYLFHLAAQPLVRLSYREPVETYATNVMGTVHLLDALRQLAPRYQTDNRTCATVFITTDKCYENREWLHAYREEDALGGYEAGRLNLAWDKAFHQLGWQPRWDFADTVARTVNWYRHSAQAHADWRALTQADTRSYQA